MVYLLIPALHLWSWRVSVGEQWWKDSPHHLDGICVPQGPSFGQSQPALSGGCGCTPDKMLLPVPTGGFQSSEFSSLPSWLERATVLWGLEGEGQFLREGVGDSRSQTGLLGTWAILTFWRITGEFSNTPKILQYWRIFMYLTSNKASFLAGINSGSAWSMGLAPSKAAGPGVGTSSFVKCTERQVSQAWPTPLRPQPWQLSACWPTGSYFLTSDTLQSLSNQFSQN